MAKLCPNCHNTIDDKSVFCDNCGTKLEVTPNTEFQQPTAPHFSPPEQQYYQPAPQYIQAEKPQPAANKSNGILISLIIGAATLVAAIVIIAIVVFPRLNFNGANNNSDIFSSVIDSGLETSEKESRYEFDDSANEPSETDATESEAESFDKPLSSLTQNSEVASSDSEIQLPYTDMTDKIEASDFVWISDAMSGSLSGSFLSNEELLGKWKGEFVFDGIWELVYVTINTDGTITVEPYKINYGDGWESESGEEPYIFNGSFDVNRVYGTGNYGKIDIYQFIESNGAQYATGKFDVNKGDTAGVYLVRP